MHINEWCSIMHISIFGDDHVAQYVLSSTKTPTLHFLWTSKAFIHFLSLPSASSISQVDTSATTCRMYISKSIHNHWALLTLNKTAHWTLHILPLNRIVWPCLFCQKTTSINTLILLACCFLSKTELDFSSFFLGDFYRNRYFFSYFFDNTALLTAAIEREQLVQANPDLNTFVRPTCSMTEPV